MLKNSFNLLVISVFGLFFVSCSKEKPKITPIAEFTETPYDIIYVNNTLPIPNLPTDNPLTIEKVQLGRMLFYEKALSKDGSMSCATCHMQEEGFSDSDQFSLGVEGMLGARQAMGVINLAWNENGFFWDGRAELLRHQALLPIQDPLEMNESLENVISKLSNSITNYPYNFYETSFKKAFKDGQINSLNISLALEAFMLTLVSDNSKYDKYLVGKAELTESEARGMELFFGEYNEFFPETSGADCAHCHSGTNFENDQYINNGLDKDETFSDLGRFDVTDNIEDKAKFKVTTLRNIAVTAPYMHDGRFNTLEEVINHYNTGINSSSTLDPALESTMGTGLMLDEVDIADIIAFLNTLTDEEFLSNENYQSPFK